MDFAYFENQKNQKFINPKFVNCTFIIGKNRNKTSIPPILKSNSTSFMFNNNFSEMNIKKVTHGVEGPRRKGGTILISSWKCNYQYLHGYPSTLLGYPLNIHTYMPSIGS